MGYTLPTWGMRYMVHDEVCLGFSAYLSLNAVFLAYLCKEPSSIINLIFWKNEAVEAGGWRCNKISMGRATVAQSWLPLQTEASQHSGSWQSTRPSINNIRIWVKMLPKITWNQLRIELPWSSSYPSSHRVSRRTLQSGPSHPSWQWHFHSPRKLALQPPWPEQPRGQPSKVQWRPFQPATQRQVPFLHCPCRLHRASQSCSSHLWPLHPASQTQAVSSHLENRHVKYRVLEIKRIFFESTIIFRLDLGEDYIFRIAHLVLLMNKCTKVENTDQ